ncbi:MAG: hypothetical protein ACKVQA_16540 [Burkholderiales bacterium]
MRRVALLLLLLAGIPLANSAGVLTVEERDLDSQPHAISAETGMVDINSTISIRIDKAALRAELEKHFPVTPAAEIKTVLLIQKQVKEGLDALPAMRQALSVWADPAKRTQESMKAMQAAVGKVAQAAIPILEHATQSNPELMAQIDQRLQAEGLSMADTYEVVFDAAAAYINDLARKAQERLTDQGIYVQMGAWLDASGANTPIHLPGFDTLPEGEFNEIKRWQLTALLSQENKELFDAAQQAAHDINAKQKSVASLFKEALPEALVSALKADQQCLKQLDDPLRNLRGHADTAVAHLQGEFDAIRREVDEFIQLGQILQARYGNVQLASQGSLPGLFSSLYADINNIRSKAQTLTSHLEALPSRIGQVAGNLGASARASADELSAKASACRKGISDHLKDLGTFANLLVNGREIGAGSLEYSDKILKHDIGRLAENTEVDLRRAGKRESGDGLILRMSEGQPDKPIVSIGERRLRMYRVLTYIDVAVSLIFADPHKDTGLNSRFHAAPSYSVLLKRGKRDSVFWNELLQPGIGINIAALDFNRDESLEVGVGLVISAFRDYLQLGYGYNLNQDSGYWFLGLRFPLPAIGSAQGQQR